MNRTLENIYSKLQQSNYKITPQRQVILKTLVKQNSEHLSAEELYLLVKKDYPDIGLATVYRTLDLLVEINILKKIDLGDNRTRYELNQYDTHYHHHMICLSCGRVQEFDHDLLETLEKLLTQKTGFQIIDHQLIFFGYCSRCKIVKQ
jgi:Fur family ferric uptake transcriptional regulator